MIVDSPDGFTFAHVDALYKQPMTGREQKAVGKTLMTVANKRGAAYIPDSNSP